MEVNGMGILIVLAFIICLHTCEINQRTLNIEKQLKQVSENAILQR